MFSLTYNIIKICTLMTNLIIEIKLWCHILNNIVWLLGGDLKQDGFFNLSYNNVCSAAQLLHSSYICSMPTDETVIKHNSSISIT